MSSIRVVLGVCAFLSLHFQIRPASGQETNWSPLRVARSYDRAAQPRSRWKLEPEPVLRIGGALDGPLAFTSVYGSFRLADGRIAVADGSSNEVRLFSSRGAFIRSFGRRGQGPGEFNHLWALNRSADTIIGLDASGRAQFFSPDGTLLRSFGRPVLRGGRAPIRAGFLSNGSAVLFGFDLETEMTGNEQLLWFRVQRQEASGDTADLFRLPAYETVGSSRPVGEMNWTPVGTVVATDQRVCAGFPATFDITCFDAAGRPLIRVVRTMERKRITEADRQFLRDAHVAANPRTSRPVLERETAAFVFADLAPAFGTMLIASNGDLWVSEFHRAMGRPGPGSWIAPSAPVQWSVFNRQGDWIAEISLPARFVPYDVGDHVTGVSFDQDEIERVVVYRVRK